MKQRILAALVIVSCWRVAGSAYADECDDMVVDTAGVLDAGGLDQVVASAKKLTDSGAVVRVRVMKTPGIAGTLDRYQAIQEKKCASWQDVSGVRRNTLISFLYQTTGGSSGRGSVRIFFGEYWKPALEPLWMPILQTKVVPFLRSDQAAQGLSVGLDNLVAAATAKATAMPSAQPSGRTTNNPPPPPPPPTDYSGLWTVLKGLLVLMAFIPIILIGVVWRRRVIARRVAQQDARSKADQCGSLVVSLDEDVLELQRGRDSLVKLVPETELAEMDRSIAVARSSIAGANERYGRLSESSASNPNTGGLSAEEYAAMDKNYLDVLGQLESARSEIRKAQSARMRVRELVESMSEKLAKLVVAIDKVAHSATDLESKGFKTTAERKQLEEATAKLDVAREMVNGKDPRKLLGLVEEGMGSAKQAQSSLDAMPVKKAKLRTALVRERARIDGIRESITARRRESADLLATYAESCCRLVKGNADEASVRLNDSVACLDKGEAALGEQEWARADKEIGQAKAWLDQAESYLQSIIVLKANLDAARVEAPRDLENVEEDLVKAGAFVDTHGSSLGEEASEMRQGLQSAAQCLAKARDGLADAKPDYLRLVKEIGKAASAINGIMSRAKEEDDRHERLLARIERLRRDAPSAVSAAREYIADHESDVGNEASELQQEAAKLFAAIDKASNLDDQVEKAEKAMKQARQAIKKAESDVEEAARRRRRARASYTPSSSTTIVSVSSSNNDYFAPAASVSVFDSGGSWGGGGGGGGGFDIGGSFGGGGGGGCDI